MYFNWVNFQTFASFLSAGTTVVALSAAWLTLAEQRQAKRDAESASKTNLLEALTIELEALKDWTGPYDSTCDYSKDGAVFLRWHAPFQGTVHPVVHNTITAAAASGIDRGLSSELVTVLVELEYELVRLERIRRQIEDITNNNLEVCESLNKKLLDANPAPNTLNVPVTLTPFETSVMSRFFKLNRNLHVSCIGNAHNGPNLCVAYASAKEKLGTEKNKKTSDTKCIELIGHWLAIVLCILGVLLMLSAFASFSIPPAAPTSS